LPWLGRKSSSEHAKEHGCARPIRFRDDGFPGNTLDRPALDGLASRTKAGETSAVLVAGILGIARNLPLHAEWSSILDELAEKLITPQGGCLTGYTEE
jgi:hypothetical protein